MNKNLDDLPATIFYPVNTVTTQWDSMIAEIVLMFML